MRIENRSTLSRMNDFHVTILQICEWSFVDMKRKWSLRDESMDMEEELPLCRWLRGSSSSSDSKASSATMSYPKETDEVESSMDFSLHIGGKKVSSSNKLSLDLQNQVDLELTLSSTPTSSVTSLSGITHHHHHQVQGHGGGGGVCTKSVHGGTLFCVAHGGGKRCVVKDCTRSARGRHGGGKRCKYEGCGKSGEGSSDFCKVHGGLVEDKRVHGGATLGPPKMDMNVDTSVVMTSRVTEGRIHGGSF
ncbi:unnamed protein product [Lactuca virosa]|uniref:Uncharacterized protein n=1 Tax=Lactuca virosa TaxID=75947 RepID=A0AAU9PPG3_9ASTR|nr:unnamed protein product [Lactuca virosa]